MTKYKIKISECFGVSPLKKTIKEAKLAILGDKKTPPSKADLTTLKQYKPKLSINLWAGKKPFYRKVVITNLYNYRQPDLLKGWSVKVTNVEDFRGKSLTYDSHNGTDFSLPPGYSVVAPASGKILRISNEYNRGGLKIFIDHGNGIVTTHNHLSRALVKTNDIVKRGQEIGVSGYSGVDAVLAFPFSPPHVHMNVWLNGKYIDPFAKNNSISLWKSYNNPLPAKDSDLNECDFIESKFTKEAFRYALSGLTDDYTEEEILSKKTFEEKSMALMFYMNYYPWRFKYRPNLYEKEFERIAILDLPFSYKDFDGCLFYDELNS
ncbi:MAG: M23 family metallopeptidase [Candidatus Sericytochromatia bacterium]